MLFWPSSLCLSVSRSGGNSAKLLKIKVVLATRKKTPHPTQNLQPPTTRKLDKERYFMAVHGLIDDEPLWIALPFYFTPFASVFPSLLLLSSPCLSLHSLSIPAKPHSSTKFLNVALLTPQKHTIKRITLRASGVLRRSRWTRKAIWRFEGWGQERWTATHGSLPGGLERESVLGEYSISDFCLLGFRETGSARVVGQGFSWPWPQ